MKRITMSLAFKFRSLFEELRHFPEYCFFFLKLLWLLG